MPYAWQIGDKGQNNCIDANCNPLSPGGLVKQPISMIAAPGGDTRRKITLTTSGYLAGLAIIKLELGSGASTPLSIDDLTIQDWAAGAGEQQFPPWGDSSDFTTQKPTIEPVPATEYLRSAYDAGQNPVPPFISTVDIVDANQAAKFTVTSRALVPLTIRFWAFINYDGAPGSPYCCPV